VIEGAWHFITGEYPPQSGGVGDYTAILAAAMADAGAEAHVWTATPGTDAPGAAVEVHRVPDAWSEAGLRQLDAALNGYPAPHRLVIQYVPNAWGQRGMNLGFCQWVRLRAQFGDEVRLMIHEPFLPYQFTLGPACWYMAWVQRRMMTLLLNAATTVYLSIPGWTEMLRHYGKGRNGGEVWLPAFSTIPVEDDPARVRDLRVEVANPQQLILGSFGTFGGEIGRLTPTVFAHVLPHARDAVGLLLGRGSARIAAQVSAAAAVPASRIFAFEDLPADEISCRLQGCDVMVQPYPDGISSRRSSAMAALAHGLPVVTNTGFLTDPLFAGTAGVAKIKGRDADLLAKLVHGFLLAEDSRIAFGAGGREFYQENFAVEHVVAKLLET
jgi:glycosyltransferase involved in cell wall biosynthesis